MSSQTTGLPVNGWRGQPLTMGQLGRVMLRHWILLVAGLMLGGIGGYVVASFIPATYTATATILVKSVPSAATPTANYEASQFAVARAKAYPTMIYNLTVLTAIQADLQTSEPVTNLRDDLTATTIADTPLVQIVATGTSPIDARDKANAAARELSRFVVQIETVNGHAPISVDTAVAAGAPRTPTSPRPLLYAALGAASGLAIALAIALIHAYVRSVHPKVVRQRRIGGTAAPKARHSVEETVDWGDGGELKGGREEEAASR